MANRPVILFTCPNCGAEDATRIIRAAGRWNGDDGATRVRECLRCRWRFTTTETITAADRPHKSEGSR